MDFDRVGSTRGSNHHLVGLEATDAVLVRQAQGGTTSALEALFRRHRPRVTGLAFTLMGRNADVEDLVQDSFAQALQSLDKLKEPAAFASWLTAIVVGTANKTFRRRHLLMRLGLWSHDPEEMDRLAARTASPEIAAELRAVSAVVNSLQTESRIALLLRRVEGMRLEDIATMMKLSLSTVKRRLGVAEQILDATRS
jgi:RNA polymerase sigma-70 factor (ECF subfamily)